MESIEQIAVRHMGAYDGNVVWYLTQANDVCVGHVADMIADRNSSAVRHMTSRDTVYVCDRDVWWPVFERACLGLVADARPDQVALADS